MFFRHGTDTGKRAAARSGGTNEAQLKELRNKARRRLIGALALVLAAFIVVPWLFDEPVSDDAHPPVVVPATPAGLPPAPPAPAPAPAESQPASGTVAAAPDTPTSGAAASGTAEATPAAEGGQPSSAGASAPPADSASPAPQPAATPDAARAEPPKTAQEDRPAAEPAKPAKPPAKPVERTDDGSVALALLAGKSPAKAQGGAAAPAPAAQGRYYLQVAAYTTEQDAQQRRDSLRQAGVTDAYVERGQSGGRTVYRLRVGPFGSHEAAQAAQARLRALGYQNGLISDK
ncbi:MAG TPA: SPOR domain-containing protein [Castellaniella sp.]|nr:SPOR domain-containing protein [Castellaniella sp.]